MLGSKPGGSQSDAAVQPSASTIKALLTGAGEMLLGSQRITRRPWVTGAKEGCLMSLTLAIMLITIELPEKSQVACLINVWRPSGLDDTVTLDMGEMLAAVVNFDGGLLALFDVVRTAT